MHFDDASLTGYLVQLPPFFSAFNCERQRLKAARKIYIYMYNANNNMGIRATFRIAFAQIHKRNQIESINNLFGDYFQSTIHTDHQHAHTRPYCRCEHPSLTVILKHFAFFSLISFLCIANRRTTVWIWKKEINGAKNAWRAWKHLNLEHLWDRQPCIARRFEWLAKAAKKKMKKIIENAENQPNYRETTQ